MKDYTVYLANGKTFTKADTRNLLLWVLRRFSFDLRASHGAWCRMLQNDCDFVDFLNMIEDLQIREE